MTEVSINGMKILFSYETPVAMRVVTCEGMEYHVTEKHWSNTTSRHINGWMPKEDRIEHTQEYFDNLIKGGSNVD